MLIMRLPHEKVCNFCSVSGNKRIYKCNVGFPVNALIASSEQALAKLYNKVLYKNTKIQ